MKSVLITGGTRGIGLGIARKYASEGFHCFLNFLSDDSNAHLALNEIEALGGSGTLLKGDVRDFALMQNQYDVIKESGHSLETLVIGAVDELPKAVDEASVDEWHKVLLTKLDGAFVAIKLAVPYLASAENPSVIFLTSADGWRPDGSYLAYQVGTGGLVTMAIANAIYLCKKYRIRVNSVAPGPVRTDLWRKAGETEELWKSLNERSPVGRVATVEDVAEAVWFLAQDPRKFLNGTTINVAGGTQWL